MIEYPDSIESIENTKVFGVAQRSAAGVLIRDITRPIQNILAALALILIATVCVGLPTTTPQKKAALRDPGDKVWREAAPAVFSVRLETSKGEFVIESHRDWAPIGVDRFYN